MKSVDAVEGNVAKIAALFPQCVTECRDMPTACGSGEASSLSNNTCPRHVPTVRYKIDWDKLRAELDPDLIQEGEERYQFTWPDKRAASRLANEATDKTLRPDLEASVDFWNTKNLYIEGDNLDVLKVLRENYLGAVKMIYIDPPYNTGNDFVYNDDFTQGKNDFEQSNGLFDEDGNQVLDPMQRNTESNGRFHTDWLNMIYPRLKVARDLLHNTGYICISIDDNEVDNMRKMADEIFGETNFVSQFIVIRSEGGGLAKRAVIGHDYMLVYAKDIEAARPLGRPKEIRGKIVKRNGEDYWIETDWFREVFGKYGTCHYEDILTFYNEAKKKEIDNGLKAGDYVLIERDGKHVVGRYRRVAEDTSKFYTIVKHLNKNGVKDLQELRLNQFFDFPKPVSLLREFILGATIMSKSEGDIILDFFSGSATTAHAVMKLNAEDGGKRRFIMVQLPEVTDEKSEAHKAGYTNICQIGEERIRRAGKQILESLRRDMPPACSTRESLFKDETSQSDVPTLDVGFRVLKLDSSNMEDVFYTPEDFDAQNIFTSVDNIKSDRTPLDLLFQVLPELDIELSANIEEKEVNGKKVFFVDGNYLIATFDTEVNESTVTEIAKMKPQYFVMRDASAANDNVLDNFEQIFRHYSPETIRKIL